MKRRIHLIHWNAEEATERATRLRAAGYQVRIDLPAPAVLARWRRKPPDAMVIDLSRLPSQGRDIAMWVRATAATRAVPLVFVEGAATKTAAVRRQLPDAVYTPWSRIRSALKAALAGKAGPPRAVASALAGYSGTSLPKKLGIKPGALVVVAGAPDEIGETLGPLPEGVRLRRYNRGPRDLTLWFVRRAAELTRGMVRMAEWTRDNDGLWIAWPKRASGVPTDVTQTLVRRTGLDAGLVDFKICAIDDTWSGLKFTRRKTR